jgi:hypothetical protein
MESLLLSATDATWLQFVLEVLAALTIAYCVYKQETIQKWEEKHLHPILKKVGKKLLQKFFGKYIERKAEEERILAECERILADTGINEDYEKLLEETSIQ